jgi:hypothetical protein
VQSNNNLDVKKTYEIRFPEKQELNISEINKLRDYFPQIQDIQTYPLMIGRPDGSIIPTKMVNLIFRGKLQPSKEKDPFKGKRMSICDLYQYLREKDFINGQFNIDEIKTTFDYYEGSRSTKTHLYCKKQV